MKPACVQRIAVFPGACSARVENKYWQVLWLNLRMWLWRKTDVAMDLCDEYGWCDGFCVMNMNVARDLCDECACCDGFV
jgi:hypothetical protein